MPAGRGRGLVHFTLSRMKKNASKAAKEIGPAGPEALLLAGPYVGIRALLGLVKSDGRPILIYSK